MCSNALREHNQPPRRTSITLQFDLHDFHQQYKKQSEECVRFWKFSYHE